MGLQNITELVIGKIVPNSQSMFDIIGTAATQFSAVKNQLSKFELKKGKNGEFDKKIRLDEIDSKIAECHANLQADPPPDSIQRVTALDSNQCLSGTYYLNAIFKIPQSVMSESEAKKYRQTRSIELNPNDLQYYLVKENMFFKDEIIGPFSGSELPDNGLDLSSVSGDVQKAIPIAAKFLANNELQYPMRMYGPNNEKLYNKVYVNYENALSVAEQKLINELTLNGVRLEGISDDPLAILEITTNTNSDVFKIFNVDLNNSAANYLVDTQKIHDNCATVNNSCPVLENGNKNSLVCKKLLDWEKWQLILNAKDKVNAANLINNQNIGIQGALISSISPKLAGQIEFGPTAVKVESSFFNLDFNAWKGKVTDPESVFNLRI